MFLLATYFINNYLKMINKINKIIFLIVWGLIRVDGMPKMQFPKWRRQNIKVIVCDFEIRIILKPFQNGPSTLPSCLQMVTTSSFQFNLWSSGLLT